MHYLSSLFAGALVASLASAAPTAPPAKTKRASASGWAGAVLTQPEGSWFQNVSATVVAPTPLDPANYDPSTNYPVYIWVGINGDGANGLLQCGFTMQIQGQNANGNGWYEWVPDPITQIPNFNVNPGDTLFISVQSTDPTGQTGNWLVWDQTSGNYQYGDYNAPSGGTLNPTGNTVEWIVEDPHGSSDPTSGGGAMAAWSSVTFTNAAAMLDDGTWVDATGASITEIYQNAEYYTSVDNEGSTVTVDYTQGVARRSVPARK